VTACFCSLRIHSTPPRRASSQKSKNKNQLARLARLRFCSLPVPHLVKKKRLDASLGRRAQLSRHWLPSSDPLHLHPFPIRVSSGLLGRGREGLSRAGLMAAAAPCGGYWGGTADTRAWTTCTRRSRRTVVASIDVLPPIACHGVPRAVVRASAYAELGG